MPGTPAAQCDYDIVTVAMNTVTGTQAIVGSCGGKTPKGFVILASRATAIGTTPVVGSMLSVGLGDDAGNMRCLSNMVENGALIAAANSGRRQANDALVHVLTTTTEALDGVAIFSSVSADTLVIDVTDAPSTAVLLEVWLFYGDTLQAFVGQVLQSASDGGTATETGIPFQPKVLIALGGAGGWATSATSARFAMGFGSLREDGTLQGQLGLPFFDRNLPTLNTADGTGFRTDSILQNIIVDGSGVLTETGRIELTSATADGFIITSRNAGGNMNVAYLALYIGKLRAWVGAADIGTTSAGNKSITDPGFKPRALFAIGSTQPVANVNTYASNSVAIHTGIGGAVGVSSITQASVCFQVQDQSSPSSQARCISDATLVSILNDVLTIDWSATLVSFDSSGFTVNVGDTSGVNALVGFLALESGSEKGWIPASRRWRRQLARM